MTPTTGQVVVFSKVPRGGRGDFRFENVATGGCTSDPAWAVAMSKFTVITVDDLYAALTGEG